MVHLTDSPFYTLNVFYVCYCGMACYMDLFERELPTRSVYIVHTKVYSIVLADKMIFNFNTAFHCKMIENI